MDLQHQVLDLRCASDSESDVGRQLCGRRVLGPGEQNALTASAHAVMGAIPTRPIQLGYKNQFQENHTLMIPLLSMVVVGSVRKQLEIHHRTQTSPLPCERQLVSPRSFRNWNTGTSVEKHVVGPVCSSLYSELGDVELLVIQSVAGAQVIVILQNSIPIYLAENLKPWTKISIHYYEGGLLSFSLIHFQFSLIHHSISFRILTLK